MCYAGDTLITVLADFFEEAAYLGTLGVTQVVCRIERLGGLE